MIEITPASLDQVTRGRGGRFIHIDNDVCGIAKQLQEIDSRAVLKYSEAGSYFLVTLRGAASHGRDHLVLTTSELDARTVERFRQVCSPSYSPGRDDEEHTTKIDRKLDKVFSEEVGEVSERLAHAVRSDLKKGRPGPVYIPPDVY